MTNYRFKSFAPPAALAVFQVNGRATFCTTSDGGVARLTPLDPSSSSSIFSNQPTGIASFSTYFSFRISGAAKAGSEGFAFVIQAATPAARGGEGSNLGYAGIASSIAVEFDTNLSMEQGDPTPNHVCVMTRGALPSSASHQYSVGAPATVPTPMNNGAVWHAWIDYTGTLLEVRLSQGSSAISMLARPEQPTLAQAVDISANVGSQQAYIGFTAANSDIRTAYHDILSWQYRDAFVPIDQRIP